MERAINIAERFSDKLGGRWKRLGPFSGEAFYDELLKPEFDLALQEGSVLHIYIDGVKGYGSSFLDQSFGQLFRDYGREKVDKHIKFHTLQYKWVVDFIKTEIWR